MLARSRRHCSDGTTLVCTYHPTPWRLQAAVTLSKTCNQFYLKCTHMQLATEPQNPSARSRLRVLAFLRVRVVRAGYGGSTRAVLHPGSGILRSGQELPGTPGDEACPTLKGHVGPGPGEDHEHAVAKPDEKKDVNAHPGEPGGESGERQPPEIRHAGGATDRRQRPFILDNGKARRTGPPGYAECSAPHGARPASPRVQRRGRVFHRSWPPPGRQ